MAFGVGRDGLLELIAGQTTEGRIFHFEEQVDHLLLCKEVVLRQYFFLVEAVGRHGLFGHLLEYTVRSSNFSELGSVGEGKRGEVALVEPNPPLGGLAVAG